MYCTCPVAIVILQFEYWAHHKYANIFIDFNTMPKTQSRVLKGTSSFKKRKFKTLHTVQMFMSHTYYSKYIMYINIGETSHDDQPAPQQRNEFNISKKMTRSILNEQNCLLHRNHRNHRMSRPLSQFRSTRVSYSKIHNYNIKTVLCFEINSLN